MGFIFDELTECNLHMVWEFCVNWATESRSNFVKVRGVDVNLTPAVLNDIVGTSPDAVSLVLTGLNIRLPYRAIRHTLCGPQSMVQWTKHNAKRYYQSLPYAHMLREARVWLNIVMHCSTPGLHYTNITRDRVCLIYYLMTPSVPEERLDYMAPLFLAPVDITKTKGPDNEFGPTLTTAEHHRRDELIMARMYGLEMLHHLNGCRASSDVQLGEVERRYPLNAHAKSLLGIGLAFHEPMDDDIPTDDDRLHTGSDVDFDSETEEVDTALAGDEGDGGDATEE
uniref:Putative plant transposon protein domain-containing protein n=1 Tax=Solanum tuberosum TaxID=4113 RepID=M1DCP2_SOLTU